MQALDTYLFTEDVQLADETELHAPIEVVGPGAAAHLASVVEGISTEGAALHSFQLGPFGEAMTRVTHLMVAGQPGWRLETEPSQAAALWAALMEAGATPGGLVAVDSLRAESLCAAVGREVTDEIYPQEARLDDAFSLTKGCYIGQEVVAKIDTYGGLNKQLFRPSPTMIRSRRGPGCSAAWTVRCATSGWSPAGPTRSPRTAESCWAT